MTRDEMIETLERVQAWMELRMVKHRDTKHKRLSDVDAVLAALRAPAVTGEAAQHAETLRVMADDHATPDTDVRRQRRAACLAGAEALAAPPAAGAPPALVALVQEWQEARRDWDETIWIEPANVNQRGERLQAAVRALLAWSPAPAPVAVVGVDWASGPDRSVALHAPVAPPADAVARVRAIAKESARLLDETADRFISMGEAFAPPAVAGGDAPEIQVGDVVIEDDEWRRARHIQTEDQARFWSSPTKLGPNALVVMGERHGQPFIWRRRQEGQ